MSSFCSIPGVKVKKTTLFFNCFLYFEKLLLLLPLYPWSPAEALPSAPVSGYSFSDSLSVNRPYKKLENVLQPLKQMSLKGYGVFFTTLAAVGTIFYRRHSVHGFGGGEAGVHPE